MGAFQGQTVGMVFEKRKDKLWETDEGHNFGVIAGGLDDVLRGNKASTGKPVTKGVKVLRATSHNVLMAVCAVLQLQGQGGHIEEAVVARNKKIWRQGSQLNSAVVDINRKAIAKEFGGAL